MKQKLWKQKCKDNILKYGVVSLLPLLNKNLVLKAFSETSMGSKIKYMIDPLFNHDDPKLDSLIEKAILALSSATIKLSKLQFVMNDCDLD